MSLRNAKRLWLLAALVLSLTGCATNSTPSPYPTLKPVQIPPPPPELMESPSSGSYSDSVRQLLLEWRKTLTDWQRRS